jgi:hypothetical protein
MRDKGLRTQDSGLRTQDSGYGRRDTGGGSSSSAGGVLFAELRVITLITKKYSILKTTTTTGKTPLAGCCVALLSKSAGADQFFFSAPYYIEAHR